MNEIINQFKRFFVKDTLDLSLFLPMVLLFSFSPLDDTSMLRFLLAGLGRLEEFRLIWKRGARDQIVASDKHR